MFRKSYKVRLKIGYFIKIGIRKEDDFSFFTNNVGRVCVEQVKNLKLSLLFSQDHLVINLKKESNIHKSNNSQFNTFENF
ncbi:hypothetical protein BpHYR1_001528 [Brachionus plicatilis]|uniref:Uncharacterized protein n=1 Tax=Brachionus plicatilis TaxID=10195 RepID=A0A3M7P2R6_BRAPC|nr:hypothetical protein BpHYR1_001528 [Brachionus plicatilis]